MLGLIALEYRKLWNFRSVRLALIVCVLLPWIWSFAPRLQEVYGLVLVNGWQVPALALIAAAQYLLPIFVAVTAAESIGSEVAAGTLAPLMLRPVSRGKLLTAKLLTVLSYPAILLAVLLLASLLAGVRPGLGLGELAGGTGLGPGSWVGEGVLSPGAAFAEVLRGYLLEFVVLMPIAVLALLFAVTYLNTAAAALATITTLLLMRLLTVFPKGLQQLLLTTYTDFYAVSGREGISQTTGLALGNVLPQGFILLVIYTVGFGLLALFAFERKDV